MARICSFNGCSRGCYGDYCIQHKPRKRLLQRTPIRQIGKKGKANKATTQAWRDQNTEFVCYLRISPMCLIRLDEQTAVPEHVVAKSKSNQIDIHDVKKIRAACTFCNQLKGSRTLESLSKEYRHLKYLL